MRTSGENMGVRLKGIPATLDKIAPVYKIKRLFGFLEECVYAIIQTGGKQYRVAPGDVLRVERLEGARGDEVTLDQVLLIADDQDLHLGQPLVANARVKAEILRQGKAKKILVFKKKRRKNYRRKQGHRQLFTALQVKEIIL